jgi:hypothetical protein
MTNRKEYQKQYHQEHYEFIRLQKTEWQRLKRKGLLGRITLSTYIEAKIGTKFYKKHKEGHCKRCWILLTSEYGGVGDGDHCGLCLKELKDEENKTKKSK